MCECIFSDKKEGNKCTARDYYCINELLPHLNPARQVNLIKMHIVVLKLGFLTSFSTQFFFVCLFLNTITVFCWLAHHKSNLKTGICVQKLLPFLFIYFIYIYYISYYFYNMQRSRFDFLLTNLLNTPCCLHVL